MADPAADTFTITELAEEFGVTPRTIRFYEDKGLLKPARQGLARIYSRRERARLKLILRGRRVGFSLAEMQEMLDLYEIGDDPVERVRLALEHSARRLGELMQQRRDIDEMISDLTEGIERIHNWLAAKTGLTEKTGPADKTAGDGGQGRRRPATSRSQTLAGQQEGTGTLSGAKRSGALRR